MNIGIFTDTFYPQISGVDTSIRMLARELRSLGHRVVIFTTTDPGAKETLPNIIRLPSVPFIFMRSRRFAVMYPPKLLRKIKSLKLDVIHTHTEFPVGIFGKVTAEILKIPMVHTYHTMYVDYLHYFAHGYILTPEIAEKYSKVFCNGAKAVITPTEKSRDSLLKYGVKRPLHVIPTGINFEPFSREKYSSAEVDDTKAEIGLNATDPIILSVGRIAKEKSSDVLIKAMPEVLKRHPSAKLVIIGDGPFLGECAGLTHSLHVQESVIFAGPKPWDTIGRYYQIGDVFVSASTSETQGLTYIEAMAAKIPVVAKRDKSVESIIKHGETGIFFDKDDELADAICKVVDSKNELALIVDKAYDNISHLSSWQFAKNVEVVYSSLLNDKSVLDAKTYGRVKKIFSIKIKKRKKRRKTAE